MRYYGKNKLKRKGKRKNGRKGRTKARNKGDGQRNSKRKVQYKEALKGKSLSSRQKTALESGQELREVSVGKTKRKNSEEG
jgi:hypothetical protein